MLAKRSQSHLLVIDVQERLAPAIAEGVQTVTNVARLIRYADILGIPTTFTEHMPERIGHSLPELLSAGVQKPDVIAKTSFSAHSEPAFTERLRHLGEADRSVAIVCGMEAHVCVLQTVTDLLANHHQVYLVADAVGSRSLQNRDLAIKRMENSGAVIVSQEMIAFEWLERGDAAEFKDILKLLK